ncbi:MAG: F0F1 ATP synthase subunit B [Mycobacterium sp.]
MGSAAGDVGVVLAAEEAGTSNFLVPNGTFFFVLGIFLIVLGVIGRFVVPPVQKVLGERERMIAKTAEDNRRAVEQEAAAEAGYRDELAVARTESSAIRDEVRAEGRSELDDLRAHANDEVSGVLQEANDELKLASDAISADLRSSVDTLSTTLASRVLGVEISGTTTAAGR